MSAYFPNRYYHWSDLTTAYYDMQKTETKPKVEPKPTVKPDSPEIDPDRRLNPKRLCPSQRRRIGDV